MPLSAENSSQNEVVLHIQEYEKSFCAFICFLDYELFVLASTKSCFSPFSLLIIQEREFVTNFLHSPVIRLFYYLNISALTFKRSQLCFCDFILFGYTHSNLNFYVFLACWTETVFYFESEFTVTGNMV